MNTERVSNGLHWFLGIGLVVFLSAPFWAESRSNITTSFYLGFLLPTILLSLLKPRNLKYLWQSLPFRVYLLFAAWAIVSIVWTNSGDDTLSLVKRPIYVAGLIVGMFLLFQWSKTTALRLLKAAAVISSLGIAYWLYIFIAAGSTPAARFSGYGPVTNPLHFSHLLGFFFMYWMISWWESPKTFPWVELIGVGLLLVALIYNNSRTPFLGIAFAIAAIMLIKRDRKTIIILLCIAALCAFFYLSPAVRIFEPNTSYRLDVWAEVIKLWRKEPLMGYGYDHGIRFFVPSAGQEFIDTHSTPLGVLYELGAIGLIMWVSLYLTIAKDFFAANKTFPLVLAGALVTFGFGASLIEGIWYLSRPKEHWYSIWIPIAIFIAAYLSEKRQAEQKIK